MVNSIKHATSLTCINWNLEQSVCCSSSTWVSKSANGLIRMLSFVDFGLPLSSSSFLVILWYFMSTMKNTGLLTVLTNYGFGRTLSDPSSLWTFAFLSSFFNNSNSTSIQPQLNSTEFGLTWKCVCTPPPTHHQPPHPITNPNSTFLTRSLRSTYEFCLNNNINIKVNNNNNNVNNNNNDNNNNNNNNNISVVTAPILTKL